MARDNKWRPGRDVPCFIPEGKESGFPATGRGVEIAGFIPEGYTAEQVVNGEYTQAMKLQEDAEVELGRKQRAKK